MTEKIENLKLTDITRNPYQPRQNFDEEKLDELAASLKENGLLQPIIVRKSALIGYELLSGERRFLAAQKAGLLEIPAIIREYNDQEMMTLSILENLQREDLSLLEEAQSLKNLQEKIGLTHENIAKTLGKSRSYVTNLIRILQLPEELQYLLEQKKLTYGHARALLGLEDEIEQLSLAREIIKKNLSVRETEQLIASYKKAEKEKKVSDKKNTDIFIQDLEEKLAKNLGTKVKITENKHHEGTVTLKFNDLQSLDNLVTLLLK